MTNKKKTISKQRKNFGLLILFPVSKAQTAVTHKLFIQHPKILRSLKILRTKDKSCEVRCKDEKKTQQKFQYFETMSSILKNPKCLRAFQPYSDENNPWEFDGVVTVGTQHEFVRLGDKDEERNYEYTPDFTRPVDDPVS
jgi:hypothetical protein